MIDRDIIDQAARESRVALRRNGYTPMLSLVITLGRKGSDLAVAKGAGKKGLDRLTKEGSEAGGTLLAAALDAEIEKLRAKVVAAPAPEEAQAEGEEE